MTSLDAWPFRLGQVLEIEFPEFTPRITFHSERELTVEIIAGANNGFSDTVKYEAVAVRNDLVMLSCQGAHRKYDRARARLHVRQGIHRGDASDRRVYAIDRSDSPSRT